MSPFRITSHHLPVVVGTVTCRARCRIQGQHTLARTRTQKEKKSALLASRPRLQFVPLLVASQKSYQLLAKQVRAAKHHDESRCQTRVDVYSKILVAEKIFLNFRFLISNFTSQQDQIDILYVRQSRGTVALQQQYRTEQYRYGTHRRSKRIIEMQDAFSTVLRSIRIHYQLKKNRCSRRFSVVRTYSTAACALVHWFMCMYSRVVQYYFLFIQYSTVSFGRFNNTEILSTLCTMLYSESVQFSSMKQWVYSLVFLIHQLLQFTVLFHGSCEDVSVV